MSVEIDKDGTVHVSIPKSLERRGRPRVQDGHALSEVMAFAVSVTEASALYADARRQGYASVSRYLRVKLGLDKRKG